MIPKYRIEVVWPCASASSPVYSMKELYARWKEAINDSTATKITLSQYTGRYQKYGYLELVERTPEELGLPLKQQTDLL